MICKYTHLLLFVVICCFLIADLSAKCQNEGTQIKERCYCRSGYTGKNCQHRNDRCEYQKINPLQFDSSFEMNDFSIDQNTVSIELSFPLYENRKYTKISFDGLEDHLNCSFPNYDDEYNRWTKNISENCREIFRADLSWEKIKRDCGWKRNETDTEIIYTNKIDIQHVDQFNISSFVLDRSTERSFDIQLSFSKFVQVSQSVSLLNDFVSSAAITQFSFDNEQKKGSFQVIVVSQYPYTTKHQSLVFENGRVLVNLLSDTFVSCDSQQKCTQQLQYEMTIKPEFKECQLSESIIMPFVVDCVDSFLRDNECMINPLSKNGTIRYDISINDLCLESSINVGLISTIETYSDEFETTSNLFALNLPIYTKIKLQTDRNIGISESRIVDLMFAREQNGAIDGVHLIQDYNITQDGISNELQLLNDDNSSEQKLKFSLNDPNFENYNTIYCKIEAAVEGSKKRLVQYESTYFSQTQPQRQTINTRSSLYGIQIKKEQINDASKVMIRLFQNSVWVFMFLLVCTIVF